MGAEQQGAAMTSGRWMVIPRTLCFIVNGDDVLLMKRAATKRIFPNQYNGVGGHLERDEDPYTGAKREIFEETGLSIRDLRLRAVYNIDTGGENGIALYVFTAVSDQRDGLIESDEGTLHWVPVKAIGDYDLVEDLPVILPRVLALSPSDPPYFVHVSYDSEDQIVMRFANTTD